MQEDSDSVVNREGDEMESRDGSHVKHQTLWSASLPVRTDLMKF